MRFLPLETVVNIPKYNSNTADPTARAPSQAQFRLAGVKTRYLQGLAQHSRGFSRDRAAQLQGKMTTVGARAARMDGMNG